MGFIEHYKTYIANGILIIVGTLIGLVTERKLRKSNEKKEEAIAEQERVRVKQDEANLSQTIEGIYANYVKHDKERTSALELRLASLEKKNAKLELQYVEIQLRNAVLEERAETREKQYFVLEQEHIKLKSDYAKLFKEHKEIRKELEDVKKGM